MVEEARALWLLTWVAAASMPWNTQQLCWLDNSDLLDLDPCSCEQKDTSKVTSLCITTFFFINFSGEKKLYIYIYDLELLSFVAVKLLVPLSESLYFIFRAQNFFINCIGILIKSEVTVPTGTSMMNKTQGWLSKTNSYQKLYVFSFINIIT